MQGLVVEVVLGADVGPYVPGRCGPSRGKLPPTAGYDPAQRVEGDRTLVKLTPLGHHRPHRVKGRHQASSPSIGGRRDRRPIYPDGPRTSS